MDGLRQLNLPRNIRQGVSLTSRQIINMRKTTYCINCHQYQGFYHYLIIVPENMTEITYKQIIDGVKILDSQKNNDNEKVNIIDPGTEYRVKIPSFTKVNSFKN